MPVLPALRSYGGRPPRSTTRFQLDYLSVGEHCAFGFLLLFTLTAVSWPCVPCPTTVAPARREQGFTLTFKTRSVASKARFKLFLYNSNKRLEPLSPRRRVHPPAPPSCLPRPRGAGGSAGPSPPGRCRGTHRKPLLAARPTPAGDPGGPPHADSWTSGAAGAVPEGTPRGILTGLLTQGARGRAAPRSREGRPTAALRPAMQLPHLSLPVFCKNAFLIVHLERPPPTASPLHGLTLFSCECYWRGEGRWPRGRTHLPGGDKDR